MRLFAALPLPEPVVEQLMRLRLRLSSAKDGLRWSEPEQWHVTLQFYGDAEAERAACLEAQLRERPLVCPEMQIAELGLFGSKGILFAAVEPTASLLALQAEVQRRGTACGVVAESRPFHPHITLARTKGKAGHNTLRHLSTPALPTLAGSMRWKAGEVLLLESILGPQGAEYLVRAHVDLSVSMQTPVEVR